MTDDVSALIQNEQEAVIQSVVRYLDASTNIDEQTSDALSHIRDAVLDEVFLQKEVPSLNRFEKWIRWLCFWRK